MHRNNLGIEGECSWGAVDKDPHYVTTSNESETNNIEEVTA